MLLVCKALRIMVLILDGNSEMGVHVRINICYLICLRHLIRSRATQIGLFPPKIPIFLDVWAACSELPPIMSTKVYTG